MSFNELFNPGAQHTQDQLESERILPVPVPEDRLHLASLPDLGVTMPGLTPQRGPDAPDDAS